jgi:hypothetical protein
VTTLKAVFKGSSSTFSALSLIALPHDINGVQEQLPAILTTAYLNGNELHSFRQYYR